MNFNFENLSTTPEKNNRYVKRNSSYDSISSSLQVEKQSPCDREARRVKLQSITSKIAT